MERRKFLKLAAATGVALSLPALTACDPDVRPLPGPATPGAFPQGVASGDPLQTSVLLWTRVEPAGRTGQVPIRWELTANQDDAPVLASGSVSTAASRDWTVLIDVSGLQPGTYYRYRFFDDTRPGGVGRSVIGRTRTASGSAATKVRLGFVSCSSFSHGYFHAYRHLAAKTIDAFVHQGDYIYEHGEAFSGTTIRPSAPPREMVSLADYRERYRCHRDDPDLQELHRLHPMIHMWDDHEFTNDPFVGGAQNHTPATEGPWATRVAAALQAYSEWMPTRLVGNRIYRTFELGSLARLILVDRQRRFLWPAAGDGDLYLGQEQMSWLDGQLASSQTPWTWLCTPTLFETWTTDLSAFGGSWNRRDQRRVISASRSSGSDLIVSSGDVHRFQAAEVILDPGTYRAGTGTGAGAVEFTCGSVTSPGAERQPLGPQIRWYDWLSRGYGLATIEASKVQYDFWGFPDAGIRQSGLPQEYWLAGFVVNKGRPALTRVSEGVS